MIPFISSSRIPENGERCQESTWLGERNGSVDSKEEEGTFAGIKMRFFFFLYQGGDHTGINFNKPHILFLFLLHVNLEKKTKIRQRSQYRSKIT